MVQLLQHIHKFTLGIGSIYLNVMSVVYFTNFFYIFQHLLNIQADTIFWDILVVGHLHQRDYKTRIRT